VAGELKWRNEKNQKDGFARLRQAGIANDHLGADASEQPIGLEHPDDEDGGEEREYKFYGSAYISTRSERNSNLPTSLGSSIAALGQRLSV
jgi:hypothetical protein